MLTHIVAKGHQHGSTGMSQRAAWRSYNTDLASGTAVRSVNAAAVGIPAHQQPARPYSPARALAPLLSALGTCHMRVPVLGSNSCLLPLPHTPLPDASQLPASRCNAALLAPHGLLPFRVKSTPLPGPALPGASEPTGGRCFVAVNAVTVRPTVPHTRAPVASPQPPSCGVGMDAQEPIADTTHDRGRSSAPTNTPHHCLPMP